MGPFQTLQDHVDSRVRVLTLPGQQKFAGFGLEFGRKALQFSESYYGIPYPLSKMDLIAVPDFAFGAMENWGAITFRENLLLHYPDVTSRSGEERMARSSRTKSPTSGSEPGHPVGLELPLAEPKLRDLFRRPRRRCALSPGMGRSGSSS